MHSPTLEDARKWLDRTYDLLETTDPRHPQLPVYWSAISALHINLDYVDAALHDDLPADVLRRNHQLAQAYLEEARNLFSLAHKELQTVKWGYMGLWAAAGAATIGLLWDRLRGR